MKSSRMSLVYMIPRLVCSVAKLPKISMLGMMTTRKMKMTRKMRMIVLGLSLHSLSFYLINLCQI